MKLKFTLLLLGISFSIFGQGTQPAGSASAELDVSNIRPTILTAGDMFHSAPNPATYPIYDAGFEVPRGSGKHSIYAGALWIGGKDPNGQVYVSSQTYRQRAQVSFWPGPVGNVHGPVHTSAYDKIWKVSKAQIQNHIQHYYKRWYIAPPDIETWPGNGNAANGEATHLAPFVDTDNDGIYSPAAGDYPDIKGDQALYLILNDKGYFKEPRSPAMNAEVHVMIYGFDDPANSPVYNTLFSQYRIINRGQVNLQDFYAGIWTDIDLGNYSDDFVGCDTLTNRYFGYNGDSHDGDTIIINAPHINYIDTFYTNGYGPNPPVQSVMFLDKRMSHFVYYNSNAHATNGNPDKALDYYNYLRGVWRDGKQLTYGLDGTDQSRPPATHMFPGNWWTENNTDNQGKTNSPGDRRALGSIGPYNLAPGQELKFTVAYTFTPGSATTSSLTKAPLDAQAVKSFFQANNLGRKVAQTPELVLHPNPANDLLTLQLPYTFESKNATIQISDRVGRVVLNTNTNLNAEKSARLNINKLDKGIYQIKVISGNQTAVSRLVKM
jgi:hypothetical protein